MLKSGKKVGFLDLEESTVGESVPLLSSSIEEDSSGDGKAKKKQSSAAAAAAGAAAGGSRSPSADSCDDVLRQLESLPALLARSCIVFTVAACCSSAIGALKSGLAERMSMLWCMLPAALACAWFAAELVRSLVRVRRVMLDEESNRILSVRKMRRQMKRRNARAEYKWQQWQQQQQQQQQPTWNIGAQRMAGKDDDSDADTGTNDDPSSRREGGLKRAAGTRLRRHISRGEFPGPTAAAAAAAAAAGGAGGAGVDPGPGLSPSSASSVDNERGEDARGRVGRETDSDGSGSGFVDRGGSQADEDLPLLTPSQRALAIGLPRLAPAYGNTASRDGSGGDGSIDERPPRSPTQRTLVRGLPPAAPAYGGGMASFDSTREYHDGDGKGGESYDDDDSNANKGALASPPRDDLKSTSLSPGMSPATRAVRISFLLQAWLRLWATMVWFALTLAVFMILLSLRLGGRASLSLPAGWIASPCMAGLTILALHSVVVLDGTGGYGGASVIRSGGNRLVVGLGRRPVILMTLLFLIVLVLKIDGSASDTAATDGGGSSGGAAAVAVLVGGAHWGYVLSPLWLLLAVLEGVYLVALWENYSGRSLTCALFGGVRDYRGVGGLGYWFCCCLDGSGCGGCPRCWKSGSGAGSGYAVGGGYSSSSSGGGAGVRQRAEQEKEGEDEDEEERLQQRSGRRAGGGSGSRRRGGGRGANRSMFRRGEAADAAAVPPPEYITPSHYRSISSRKRVELTPSQRAAAASMAGGIFLLAMAVILFALGSVNEQANWGVPLTMVTAAAGLALVGAGLFHLTSAHSRAMSAPLPPEAKPLPLLFSERHGGWVACPPDPPVVSIFLLGDVTLREEGFGWDGDGGSDGDGGDIGDYWCWSPSVLRPAD
ncbi:unnamed protein product [Pylaiella littoralis]